MSKPASVVIPTWNAAADVLRVLELLALQEGALFEVVVVDNGVVNRETELVCERLRARFPGGLRYLRFEKQLGYAGAVNEGATAAAHDLVAVINNDNLPEPRWLVELLRAYEERRAAGREAIITSHVHRADFPDPFGARFNLWGRIVRVPRPLGEYVPFHPDGSAFLFSRAAFGRPYDDDYYIYHEDVALGWRAWLEGKEVALAEASRAETFDGGSTRRIRYLTAFYTERNRWLNYLTFLSFPSLLKASPLLKAEALFKLAFGTNRRAKLHAWAWILTHPRVILAKRRAVQARRKRLDREILPRISGNYFAEGSARNMLLRGYESLVRLPLG